MQRYGELRKELRVNFEGNKKEENIKYLLDKVGLSDFLGSLQFAFCYHYSSSVFTHTQGR